MRMKIYKEFYNDATTEKFEFIKEKMKYVSAFKSGLPINENGKEFIVCNVSYSEGIVNSIEVELLKYVHEKDNKYTFAEHQKLVQRTRNNNETELPNYALGLVCEAGEFGDMVKKHIYQGHGLDLNKCEEELGDVLWYLANICNVLNIDLAEVAKGNVEKLKKRYPEGFSKNDSVRRVDIENK